MIYQNRGQVNYQSYSNNHQQKNRWNILYDHQANKSKIEDIQLGKERIKIFNYVQDQMNPEVYQENKRMLQKFRIDAIKHRNQRVMNHLGKSPYLTQSMLPEGSSIDSSKLIQTPKKYEKTPTLINRNNSISVNPNYSPIYIPMRKNKVIQDTIYYSSKKGGKKRFNDYPSIDLSDISEEENELKQRKKKVHRFSNREQQKEAEKQQQKLNQIESMLKKLNKQLQKNTSSIIKYTEQQNFHPRFTRTKPRSQTQSYELDSTDSLSLYRSHTRAAVQSNRGNIKKHLELIKKKRNRLQFIE